MDKFTVWFSILYYFTLYFYMLYTVEQMMALSIVGMGIYFEKKMEMKSTCHTIQIWGILEISSFISKELTRRLVIKHNLLIKDLPTKMRKGDRQYIRLAIRNMEDNEKLIKALKAETVHIGK